MCYTFVNVLKKCPNKEKMNKEQVAAKLKAYNLGL